MTAYEELKQKVEEWRSEADRRLRGFAATTFRACADDLTPILAKLEQERLDYTLVPNSALRWLFGEEGDFVDPQPEGKYKRNFWWRSEFRKRAALEAQCQPPEVDELQNLNEMPDSSIDTSDIPEVTDWSKAVRGKFYRSQPPEGK